MGHELPWWMRVGAGPSPRTARMFLDEVADDPAGEGESTGEQEAAATELRLAGAERALPPSRGRAGLSAAERREYLRRMGIVR